MNARLTTTLLAAAILSISATAAFACDGKDASKTSAATASAVKADAKASCASKAASAVTADAKASCASKAASAVTADAKASCASKAASAVTADTKASCASKAASAVTADAKASCSSKAASAASASDCCASKGASATMANASGCSSSLEANVVRAASASSKGVDAVAAGSSCSSHASKMSTAMAKGNCVVCDEYAGCDEKLKKASAVTQVVPLKNGVMFVYTASNNKNVRAVQAAVQSRQDRLSEVASASANVALCDGCKSMRGAMASGKLRREVVNVEGGSLTLVTSEDPGVVKAIQEASGVTTPTAKS